LSSSNVLLINASVLNFPASWSIFSIIDLYFL
jgi:hypothetical protein